MSMSGAALSSMLRYPDKKTLSKEKLNFLKEKNLKDNKIQTISNTGNTTKPVKNTAITNQFNPNSQLKRPIKEASNFENLLEKLKHNKNDLRLFKKENFNFKSENTFNNLNLPAKPKLKESEKDYSTISYREENIDQRTYTEEHSEISSLLNNIKNLKTEENKRMINLNNNNNNNNNLNRINNQNFHTISNTNKSLVSNAAANNHATLNINNFYNNFNNNNLEIIVEQSDTIRCSSQNNTATLASMGLTNKKNAYDEIFMNTNNSNNNKSNSKNNYNNNNNPKNPDDNCHNDNNQFYFKNHLNTQREILFGIKDTDGQISEKDLIEDYASNGKINNNNRSMEMNNYQSFKASDDLTSCNNPNTKSNLIFNYNKLSNEEEKKMHSFQTNQLTLKNNNFLIKENNAETHPNHQDLENLVKNKIMSKNRTSQNSIIKSTFDIKKSDSNFNFNLNNSYENSSNAKSNDFIIDNEISSRYNNYTEANIPNANNVLGINKSSNIVNNHLLINNNFFIENKNFINNEIKNCVIIDSKSSLISNNTNNAPSLISNNLNANKNAFVQSKEKLSKNTSQSNISSIHKNSNSVISDLNPFTNRNLTNRVNDKVNFNTLIAKDNIADNIREKTLSTKNANAANNNFSFNLNNNNNNLINTFRSNKNNSMNINNKDIGLNKLNNLNNQNTQINHLVKIKNDSSTNTNKFNEEKTSSNNDKNNNQIQQLARKRSIENQKSSNSKDNSKLLNEEDETKTEHMDKLNSKYNDNNHKNLNFINNNINNNNHNFCINLDQNFYHVNNYQYLLGKSGNKPEESKQTPYELLQEIFENLLKEERESIRQFGYMKKQVSLNENMRAILIDWIIEVHYKFKLLPETLFLTVNLIDRFLTGISDLSKEKLQLAGISAMLIACKYEEIYSPELRDFVYISDKSYDSEDILKMESEMLKILQFEICFPSVNRFFEILCIIFNFSDKETVLGKYLTEIFLIDYRYTKYSSSLIACAACYLIKKDERKDKLKDMLNLSQSDLTVFKECVKDICFIVEHIDQTDLIAIKKKYATKENYKFAKLKMLDLL